jgi:hypothetical protein
MKRENKAEVFNPKFEDFADYYGFHIRLCQPYQARTKAKAKSKLVYISKTVKAYFNLSFEEYVRKIDVYPDESFDLVVVDGRARTACRYHTIKKIKRRILIIR